MLPHWPSVTGWPGTAVPHQATRPASDGAWDAWLAEHFPTYVRAGYAPRHVALWEWVWAIAAGQRPPPFVGIWPRGGGKSTTAELACTAVAAREVRRYGWYLCETQDQADDHVANVAALLEVAGFDRAVNKYGQSKGWRRNRVRTPFFTLDALGLDVARRGSKLDEQRPDWLVIDDVDGEVDTEETTTKKIMTITRKLLPAGTPDLAVLAIQNTVHPNSIFARLADGRADFLHDRIVSGPEPALRDFAYDDRDGRIVSGTPTWGGQSLDACADYIRTWGVDAFRAECQHESVAGALAFLPHIALWEACQGVLPPLDRRTPVILALDGAVSGDTFGVVAVSRHPERRNDVAVRFVRGYVPPPDGALDYKAIARDLRAFIRSHNVTQLTFDPYQLHHMAQELSDGHGGGPLPDGSIEPPTSGVWCEAFGQTTERAVADKALLDLIVGQRITHGGEADLAQHVANANRKPEGDRKIRIVKGRGKIDLVVTLSMGAHRCLSLNLW